MNARSDLYGQLMAGRWNSPDRSERASEFIDAFQREVQRADAAKVRAAAGGYICGAHELADLIDPGVKP